LRFVIFKELLLVVYEEKRFFILALLDKDFDIQADELPVHFKFGLFHQLEQQQVGNIQYLCLEFQSHRDQVHAFDTPLGIDRPLVDLIQLQRLVLLLQDFVLTDIRKEQLFADINVVCMLRFDSFEEAGRVGIFTERGKDADQVFDSVGIGLFEGLYFGQNLLAIRIFVCLHVTEGLDSLVERLLLLFGEL
jgi:hypothetical protein